MHCDRQNSKISQKILYALENTHLFLAIQWNANLGAIWGDFVGITNLPSYLPLN